MVFGVFDGIHPGHRVFLRQARKFGRELIAVVARDEAVWKLKKRMPKAGEQARLAALRAVLGGQSARSSATAQYRVVLGDRRQGSYGVIRKFKPDVICLGYDQKTFARDLKEKMRKGELPKIRLERLKPYYPSKFHSSLMK